MTITLGYFRLGAEAVCIWESDSGDAGIDIDRATGKRHVLAWRSDASKPRPVTAEEIESLADELGLRPVTTEEWIEFQRAGRWPVAGKAAAS